MKKEIIEFDSFANDYKFKEIKPEIVWFIKGDEKFGIFTCCDEIEEPGNYYWIVRKENFLYIGESTRLEISLKQCLKTYISFVKNIRHIDNFLKGSTVYNSAEIYILIAKGIR